jgi:ABC-type uncharacterized transport system permease subunit
MSVWEFVLALAGVALYAAAAIIAVVGLARQSSRMRRWIPVLLVLGMVPLMMEMALRGMHGDARGAMTRFEAFTVYVLVMTVGYLLMCGRWRRLAGLAPIVVPFVTFILILGIPAVGSDVTVLPKVHNIWLSLHVACAFFAYACFSLSGLLAVAYLVQDRALKRRQPGAMFERLPPLETLDRLMSYQLGAGLVLLTTAIVLGILLIRLEGWAHSWVTDPKVMATLVTWCVFAALVHMRTVAHRHGRRAAFMIILGLLCLFFAFVGVHVVSKSLHDYLMVGG